MARGSLTRLFLTLAGNFICASVSAVWPLLLNDDIFVAQNPESGAIEDDITLQAILPPLPSASGARDSGTAKTEACGQLCGGNDEGCELGPSCLEAVAVGATMSSEGVRSDDFSDVKGCVVSYIRQGITG